MSKCTREARTCQMCGKEYLPKSNVQRYCNDCRREKHNMEERTRRSEHRAAFCIKDKIYHAAHRDEMNEKSRQYGLSHKVEIRESGIRYRQVNREMLSVKEKLNRHTPGRTAIRKTVALKRNNEMRAAGKLDTAAFYAKCDTLEWHCQICDTVLTKQIVTVDHIIPVSKGGTNAIENLQPLCFHCNASKGAKIMEVKL